MDDCPCCGESCPIRKVTRHPYKTLFICWDCLVSWDRMEGYPVRYGGSAMAGVGLRLIEHSY